VTKGRGCVVVGEVQSTKLSIIIVNFNTLSYLKDCLSNLQSLALPFNFETIVVDNGSSDGSREWLKTQSYGKYILSPENLGFARGNNLAIKEARGEYILLLNTDAFPQKGSIERLINFLETHDQAGIAGPQLSFPSGCWQRGYNYTPSVKKALMLLFTDMQDFFYAWFWPVIDKLGLARPKKVDAVYGCCMMIKSEVLHNIGLLDEAFFFLAEDSEFCYRARQKGYGVYYVPQAKTIHVRGGSSVQKNMEKTLRFRYESEKLFISRAFGMNAWKRYSRIMYINFLARYQIAWIFHLPARQYFSCALREFKRRG
jgi:hypothetical protein